MKQNNHLHKGAPRQPNQQRTDHIEQQRAINRLDCPGKPEDALSWTELLGNR